MTDPAGFGHDDLVAAATVVVVDDHEPNLVLLHRILAEAGVKSIHLSMDPAGVVELCASVRPDLVLLDLHMPGMDGVATMAALRAASDGGGFLPIVVLTADATSEARERVLAAGANDFLTKPVDQTEVVLRARNLLHTRALHLRVQEDNRALQAEVTERRAAEEQARLEAEAMTARVREAIDSGAPRMVFQPIVDLASHAVVGYEALARFDTEPRRTPDVWFDEAAKAGLATELELAAVRGALRQLRSLPAGALLSINVSPEVAMLPALAAALTGTGSPGRLVVEVTEHVRIPDYDALVRALDSLRNKGVRIAVDDAGAGFASLQHILRLRPDVIKLDIGLVRDIDTDPIKRALASSLVTFGTEIGAVLIAEGVETAAELDTLTALGLAWGQGYHLGRPGDLADVADVADVGRVAFADSGAPSRATGRL